MQIKKSLSLTLAVLFMLLTAAACGGAPAAPEGPFTADDLGVMLDGKVYYLREDSAPLLAALGDGYEYSEMVSCVYDGKDKTYTYPGITVSTVPVDGKDVTEMITLTDAAYSTLRGAKVGDSTASLQEKYGENYFDDGYITYSVSGDPADIEAERIQFEYADGSVSRIYIYSPSY